jgi:hypothetical protein
MHHRRQGFKNLFIKNVPTAVEESKPASSRGPGDKIRIGKDSKPQKTSNLAL